MANISVEQQSPNTYRVTVEEGHSISTHTVTCGDTYFQKIGGSFESKEALIKQSFEFLLQRNRKNPSCQNSIYR